jgi:hypothetical protein
MTQSVSMLSYIKVHLQNVYLLYVIFFLITNNLIANLV